jgi:GTP diphosphokinase / guanosine-3',5'-bis(diphosphate) 3'-diphosphatase
MTLAYEAMLFAREVHKDQKRRYTGQPYSDHLAEVAGIVAAAQIRVPVYEYIPGTSIAIAVAFLHDTREDWGVAHDDLVERFGREVAFGVAALSDLEIGNRAARKAASRERLSTAPGWVQSIKCADLISNTSSIVMHDPKFAVTYLEEKRLLLDVMTKADPRLVAIARGQVGA